MTCWPTSPSQCHRSRVWCASGYEPVVLALWIVIYVSGWESGRDLLGDAALDCGDALKSVVDLFAKAGHVPDVLS